MSCIHKWNDRKKRRKEIFIHLKIKKETVSFFLPRNIYLVLPPPCAYCIQEILFVVICGQNRKGVVHFPLYYSYEKITNFYFFFFCVCVFVMIHHGYVRRVDCRTQAYGPTIQVETICTTRIYSYDKFRVNGLDNYSVYTTIGHPKEKKYSLVYNKRVRETFTKYKSRICTGEL